MNSVSRSDIILIVVLLVLHLVGFIGLQSSHMALFMVLTPFNLYLSCILLLMGHKRWTLTDGLVMAGIFIAGYLVELVGVKTGIPFGSYVYGEVLGRKLLGVPFVIGVNWLMLVYGSYQITKWMKVPAMVKIGLAATIMVGLDLLIEPVAIWFGYWSWDGGTIPLENYVAWFGVALAMLLALHKYSSKEWNPVGLGLIVVQALFFGGLNIVIG